jgi:ribosomal protein S12 methylthiotransferase
MPVIVVMERCKISHERVDVTMPHNVWIESLGCAKNQVDSEVMLGMLNSAGFIVADDPECAEVIIVNTCGFIESATEESIETILEMAGAKEAGSCKGLIVAGCLYQRYGDRLRKEMPEVDAFIGCGELEKIADACRSVLGEGQPIEAHAPETPRYLYDHETPRAFLNGTASSVYVKIAEGCDNRCAYCTIPRLRGGYRSRSTDSVVKEARELLHRGAKEINIIAQDTTYFGLPETGEEKLTSLLRRLDDIRGKKWLRLLYAHPARITSAVARAIDDSRSVCHYIDMPIQHVCDDILKAMGRKGSSGDIHRAIGTLRSEVPDIAIRTTLMVGFPGETDRHFQEMLEFVQEARFDRMGVFKYSPEAGTAAAGLGKRVPEDVKEERYEALMREQGSISYALNREFVGKRMEALVESEDGSAPQTVIGRTYRDAPEVDGFVRVSYEGSPPPIGEFVHVEITGASEHDLEGKLL